QPPPDLLHAVDAEVLLVHAYDLDLQLLITQPARRRRPGRGGVVRGRGDLQRLADRLDPPAVPMSVDQGHYFGSRGSSSRAKKLAAALRISLARRSSRFSRSSSAMRRRSSVVVPGRRPSSTSACLTQLRSDSTPIPS